ncbi:MAG: type III-A CRISPR-associated RAMP protein Csm5 [Chloroflexi bacterium]|nr:MAG: type III-A CRISPR-associated RAMP protein Csm5 [Chloroflexota bacterium]
MSLYKINITTLSPVHIGDGNELRLRFDIAVKDGYTYRINEDTLLRAKEAQLRAPNRDGTYPLPGDLLRGDDWENDDFFRYVLRGKPRSKKIYAEVKSFIKDINDRPYIPGSSLKGALRTALAWTGWDEVNPRVDRNSMGRRRNWAGQNIEKTLFGRNPNYDLLRALQVSDLFGPQEAGEGLMLVNAQVLTKKSAGSPIEMEALRGDTSFHGTLKTDDSLFDMPEARKLDFAKRKHWLDELVARAQKHSRTRIKDLQLWYEDAGQTRVSNFYALLYDLAVNKNQALLQLGWGTGWDGKTFGSHLQEDPYLFEKIISDFRMHKRNRNAPPRQVGDAFPRSKRAVVKGKGKDAIALAPFGWVVFEMEKIK